MTLTALPAGMNVGARSKVSIISPVRGKAEQVRDQAGHQHPDGETGAAAAAS